ncbi:NAD(P)H-quinone oxidoreductase subunit O [Cyanobium sp.]|nr:NAD(P)H-quinone oxidoreductase subunit O [Cyanobium sp.]
MAETSAATPAAAAPASSPPVALKKGALVRLNLKAYASSLEAAASVSAAPAYVVQGPGEILSIKGEYAQLRWRRPVPDVWLRLDQLEPWNEG